MLSLGGGEAMRGTLVFWAGNWKWAGANTTFAIKSPYDYAATIEVPSLKLSVQARARRATPQRLVWVLDVTAGEARRDVMGGGIAFHFDAEVARLHMGDPELLPGNRGWAWGRQGGDRVEMRFDPPLAHVYFEPGRNKSEIRAFVYRGDIPAGPRRYVATMDLTGDMVVGPTVSERFGPADPAAWPANILDWRTSPVDLSFLNATERPAGKRGFVKVDGDRLVFADGTPARFWGTNLTASALFGGSDAGIKQAARRLSQLGFNLVRLHHHDSTWVVPNIFGGGEVTTTRRLDPRSLERLDAVIAALKDEGIYIWLDLHVGRQLRANDGIEAFQEISKGKTSADLRGYNYVNPSIEDAMKEFNRAYVNRVNRYTGIAYKDDPAVMGMLVTNENDVTHHFGNALLGNRGVPWHGAIYMRRAAAFAAAKGLPPDRTWRSWEHGPSKLFLNDLERRFHASMIQHLREQGVKVPIAPTSQWGDNPMSSLPALTAGDVIDGHDYGGVGELERNPLYASSFVHGLAAGQVVGKPFTVTEWNVDGFPVPDRHGAPLYLAASAAHQGWAATMQYAYTQVPLDDAGGPSNWHAFNDPSMIATLPAAALLFRRGDVRQATSTYVFAPSRETLFYQPLRGRNSVALRTAMEKGRLLIAMPATPELPWLAPSAIPSGATVIRDPDRSLIPAGATEGVSDTGELRRDWANGVFTIRTRYTQAATGWLGGRSIALGDVDVRVSTANASVAVQSLTSEPLGTSRAVLIALGARSATPAARRLPFHAEPVQGELSIRAPAGLRLHTHPNGDNQRREIPTTYRDGRYVVRLDPSLRTYWLMLSAAK